MRTSDPGRPIDHEARFGARTPPTPPVAQPATGFRGPDDDVPWQVAAGSGMLVGLLLLAVSAIIVLLGGWQFRGANSPLNALWLLVALGGLGGGISVAVLLRGLRSLRYAFMSNAFVINWARDRFVVPYADIIAVEDDQQSIGKSGGYERFWPGYYVFTARRPNGVWRVFATQPPPRRVYIRTTTGGVAISPHRAVLFIRELERRRFGVARPGVEPPVGRAEPAAVEPPRHARNRVAEAEIAPGTSYRQKATHDRRAARRATGSGMSTGAMYRALFREQLLEDPVASLLIGGGVLIPLMMAAYLFNQYEGLPREIGLHWDAHGVLDRVGAPRELWLLPLTAALFVVVNAALATVAIAFDRFAARLILAATPIAQVTTAIALLRLVN